MVWIEGIQKRLILNVRLKSSAYMHELITWKERAHASGIGRGSLVSFVFEGTRLQGRVNRVTKRATVLVEDAAGQRYSDGGRYRTFYVPLAALEPVSQTNHALVGFQETV